MAATQGEGLGQARRAGAQPQVEVKILVWRVSPCELRWKSRDATHLATDGPAPRRYDRCTASTVRCAAVFVRSEKSNALVSDGVLQPAPRSANLDSAFGGMQLFATEAWRAAPLLLTRSAQLAQPTVRLPQLSQRWARPHWPSVTCAAACVSDTARQLPAHCETMGVR